MISLVIALLLCVELVASLAAKKVHVTYPTELLQSTSDSIFSANVTQNKLVCFGNDEYAAPTYKDTLYCMLPYFPKTSKFCNSVWGSRSVEIEVVGSVEFLKVTKLPRETVHRASFITNPSSIESLELSTTRWLQYSTHITGHDLHREIIQIPAEPIYLCARSTDWQGRTAHFSMKFRSAYLRARDKRLCNDHTLLHIALILAVSSAWFVPYLTALLAATLAYEHGLKIMLTLFMMSSCVVCLTPLMLTKHNRQLARHYFNYFFTRMQAHDTRHQIKKRLPVFQALFFSSLLVFLGFGCTYLAYYAGLVERETRNKCFKIVLSAAISWLVFSICRSFERFFKDWLWLGMSVSLANLLDHRLNPMCRDEVVVATIMISQCVRLIAPWFVQFEFINTLISTNLPHIEGVSSKLRIPLPYQIYEHHSLRHLVEGDTVSRSAHVSPHHLPGGLISSVGTSTGDLGALSLRRTSSSRNSLTHLSELHPLVDYIDEVVEGSICNEEQGEELMREELSCDSDSDCDSGNLEEVIQYNGVDVDVADEDEHGDKNKEFLLEDVNLTGHSSVRYPSRSFSKQHDSQRVDLGNASGRNNKNMRRVLEDNRRSSGFQEVDTTGSVNPNMRCRVDESKATMPLWERLLGVHKSHQRRRQQQQQQQQQQQAKQQQQDKQERGNTVLLLEEQNRVALLECEGIILSDIPHITTITPSSDLLHDLAPTSVTESSSTISVVDECSAKLEGRKSRTKASKKGLEAATSILTSARPAAPIPVTINETMRMSNVVGALHVPLSLIGPFNVYSVSETTSTQQQHKARQMVRVWLPLSTYDSEGIIGRLQGVCGAVVRSEVSCTHVPAVDPSVVFSVDINSFTAGTDRGTVAGTSTGSDSSSDSDDSVIGGNSRAKLHVRLEKALGSEVIHQSLHGAIPCAIECYSRPCSGITDTLFLRMTPTARPTNLSTNTDTNSSSTFGIVELLKQGKQSVQRIIREVGCVPVGHIKVNHHAADSFVHLIPSMQFIFAECVVELPTASAVDALITAHCLCSTLESSAHIQNALQAVCVALRGSVMESVSLTQCSSFHITRDPVIPNRVIVTAKVPLALVQLEHLQDACRADASWDCVGVAAAAKCRSLLLGAKPMVSGVPSTQSKSTQPTSRTTTRTTRTNTVKSRKRDNWGVRGSIECHNLDHSIAVLVIVSYIAHLLVE